MSINLTMDKHKYKIMACSKMITLLHNQQCEANVNYFAIINSPWSLQLTHSVLKVEIDVIVCFWVSMVSIMIHCNN